MAEPASSPDDRSFAWTLVLIAAVFEVAWAVGLPFTEGFTRPVPSILVVAAMIAAFLPLARATRTLPIGPAYAVWTGLGATGTAGFGLLVHEEPVTTMRLLGITLVIAGVVGLRVFDRSGESS